MCDYFHLPFLCSFIFKCFSDTEVLKRLYFDIDQTFEEQNSLF